MIFMISILVGLFLRNFLELIMKIIWKFLTCCKKDNLMITSDYDEVADEMFEKYCPLTNEI